MWRRSFYGYKCESAVRIRQLTALVTKLPDNFNKPCVAERNEIALHLARDVYVSLSLAAERVFKNVNKIKCWTSIKGYCVYSQISSSSLCQSFVTHIKLRIDVFLQRVVWLQQSFRKIQELTQLFTLPERKTGFAWARRYEQPLRHFDSWVCLTVTWVWRDH